MAGNVKGLDELIAKLTAMQTGALGALQTAVDQTVIKTAASARELAKKSNYSQAGGSGSASLKESITTETTRGIDSVSGRVIANSDHATYVEYGTGWPIGHKITKTIHRKNGKSYTIEGWLFPVSDGLRVTKGMPPRPFMHPALEKNRSTFLNACKHNLKTVFK